MRLIPDASRLARISAGAAWAFVLLIATGSAQAQFEDCGDTIALYSPTGFSAAFEVATSPQRVDGVRLRWDDIPDSNAGCVRLAIDPVLEAELGMELRGSYRNRFDRNITIDFIQPGRVGDPDQTRFEISVSNTHPNPAAGSLSSILNLSSAGGMYRFVPGMNANVAEQANAGIPAHLGDVSINAIAASKDHSVVYAAVVGVPVVRSFDQGATWEEPVQRIFPPFSQRMSELVVFPDDNDRVWVGVTGRGVWESVDGAVSWTQIFPAGVGPTSTVTAMKFLTVTGSDGTEVERLYLAVKSQALAYSDDGGNTFVAVGDFITPSLNDSSVGADCELLVSNRLDVFDVEVSPTDPSRIYVGVGRWGVYMGDTRDHSAWTPRFSGLVVCSSDSLDTRLFGEQRTVVELAVLDNAGQDLLVAATENQGSPTGTADLRSTTIMFVSVDGGQQWTTKGDGYPVNADENAVAVTDLILDPRPGNSLGVIASTFGEGLYELNLGGGPGQGNWIPMLFVSGAEIRNLRTSTLAVVPDGSGVEHLLVGTSDSGVYQPGVWIDLTRALNRTAQSFDEVRNLGLEMRFTRPGVVMGDESFSIKAQNFRGYAVWRAPDLDEVTAVPGWELIGLLDLSNPETCVLQTCDEIAQPIEVNCFANKRANCFVPQLDMESRTVSWEFFDRDVFNGFTYWYAVSSFDFGYTGETSLESFNGGMVFSPRWPVETDPASAIFNDLAGGQNYNGRLFQVNVAAVADSIGLRDDTIFVVPNPLVRSAGWDLGDASSIRIVNVTASSRAEIYTMAGDLVRKITNVDFEGVERGNIEWDTRNQDGEPVSSGVYIYRVTDDLGGEIIGRFTIIR